MPKKPTKEPSTTQGEIAELTETPQAKEHSNTTQEPCGITTAIVITREELQAMISEAVKQELRAVLGGEVHALSRGNRPEKTVEKKTFSIDPALWQRFCALFPEKGMRSAHVNRALDFYVKLKENSQGIPS